MPKTKTSGTSVSSFRPLPQNVYRPVSDSMLARRGNRDLYLRWESEAAEFVRKRIPESDERGVESAAKSMLEILRRLHITTAKERS